MENVSPSRDGSPPGGMDARRPSTRCTENSPQTAADGTHECSEVLVNAAGKGPARTGEGIENRSRGGPPHAKCFRAAPPSFLSRLGMSVGRQHYETWPMRPARGSPQTGPRPGGSPASRDEPMADAEEGAESLRSMRRLTEFVAVCEEKPSLTLSSWLSVSGCELMSQIHSHILEMADVLFAPSAQFICIPSEDKAEAGTVVKLFYKALEDLLLVEQQRCPNGEFVVLLSSAPFRQSLFACCAVVTTTSYRTPYLDHRAVVEKLGITAFDLRKIIELFVKACPLPDELKDELDAVEEEIIGSLAWQPNSSIYSYIKQADKCLRNLQDEDPSSHSGDAPGLPVKLGFAMRGLRTSTFATLNDFFRRSLKLSVLWLFEIQRHIRATASQLFTHQIISVMQFALYERTKLFYNRHLYQILLCAVYGVCKANGATVTFKQLTSHYMKNANGQARVYTTVVLRQTELELWVQEYGDIICFYNKVFLPALNNYLQNMVGKRVL